MRCWIGAMLLIIGLCTPAFAQQVAEGDTVKLVEREINIPAHPAAGNSQVAFRFVGGSTAQVLAIDASTGWLQIQGEQVGGVEATGWITKAFVAERVGGPSPELAWCPSKGSPNPHPGRVRIATWNLETLDAVDGQSTFTGTDPSVKRFAVDYERIKCYVRLFDPDILAVQEVDGEAALMRVVDLDVYNIVVDQRPKPNNMNAKQNTGFAFKKGLSVEVKDDFRDLDISHGALRYGSRIDLTIGGHTFQLMSVHLKSGCFDNHTSGSACNTLLAQIPVLEGWIDQAAPGPNPFIILGDFNRRVDQPGDDVWAQLDDGQPPDADLTSVTDNMPISCRDNQFGEFIDHIVFDKRAIQFVDRSSFRQITYRQADKLVWDKLSDHCPIVVEMWVP